MNQNNALFAYAATVDSPKEILRSIKGSFWEKADPKIVFLLIFSILIHLFLLYYFQSIKITEETHTLIEEIPERFAKLIIEKPISKTTSSIDSKPSGKQAETASTKETSIGQSGKSSEKQTIAQKTVAARMARVEESIRTVGVLGMLTGVGKTAKGPSVIDVLGKIGDKKESFLDLDKTLEGITGLTKLERTGVLGKKAVKSKDISMSYKEEISDLITNIGTAKTIDLAKKGTFIIQKPESIEGAASSSAKRNQSTINAIVSSHRTSIRMSYEKYLKRDPNLAGKISVKFTISALGSVSQITIIENTTNNTELEQEIIRKIRMWRFESIPEGDVSVTYPFLFAPAS